MSLQRFRPAPVPTLFVIAGLIILANLGLWQLRRHYAQLDRLAAVEERLTAPPIDNPDLGPPWESLEWRRAVLAGTWAEGEPALISGRYEFHQPGFDVVQPLALDDGLVVLVNRGWIPMEGWEEHLAAVQVSGPGTVEGLLRTFHGDPEAAPTPATDHLPERWPPRSWAALALHLADDPAPLYLMAGEAMQPGQLKDPEVLPVTGYRAHPRTIGHLEYAMTWFLIFGTLLAIWMIAGFRRGARLARDA